jgi:integrase
MPTQRKPKYPLWLHPTGQWTKKIGGRQYYFGTDRDEALKQYMAVKEDLEAGRKPRDRRSTTTVADAVNAFLTQKHNRVKSGELKAKTWADYNAACKAVVDEFGRTRTVADLRPDDFAQLRARLAARLGPVSLTDVVVRVRVLFKFAFDFGLIDAPVRYGNSFDRPARKVLRLERARKGLRLLSAADAWKLIDAADPQLRAMTLLGLNGGMGATDCAQLTRRSLSMRAGWLDYPRPKTGVSRRFPLWPETAAALEAVHKVRKAPKDPADADKVFMTRCGHPWVRFDGEDGKRSTHDAVGLQFRKLAEKCGVSLVGRFNILRHTFRTVADEVGDRPAIDLVMGHADGSTAGHYRELVADERLTAITDRVRGWLMAGRAELAPTTDDLSS